MVDKDGVWKMVCVCVWKMVRVKDGVWKMLCESSVWKMVDKDG